MPPTGQGSNPDEPGYPGQSGDFWLQRLRLLPPPFITATGLRHSEQEEQGGTPERAKVYTAHARESLHRTPLRQEGGGRNGDLSPPYTAQIFRTYGGALEPAQGPSSPSRVLTKAREYHLRRGRSQLGGGGGVGGGGGCVFPDERHHGILVSRASVGDGVRLVPGLCAGWGWQGEK